MASSTLLVLFASPFFLFRWQAPSEGPLKSAPVAAARLVCPSAVTWRGDRAAFWIVAADPDRRADPAHTGIISDLNSIDIMAEIAPKNNAHCTIPDDEEQSTYRFIIVAAKRARQLQGGARPMLPTSSKKFTIIGDGGSAPRVGEVFSHWTGVGTAGREACPLSARRHAGRGESFPSDHSRRRRRIAA